MEPNNLPTPEDQSSTGIPEQSSLPGTQFGQKATKATSKKDKTPGLSHKVHSMLLAGSLLLIAILVSSIFVFFKPVSVAEKFANRFMDAASTGNSEELVNITQEQDEYVKKFLTSASVQLKGTYKLTEKKQEGSLWYFLYELKDAPTAYARVVIDTQSGEKISSLVYASPNNQKLELIPTDFPKEDNASIVATTTTDDDFVCLEQKDYAYANSPQEDDFIIWDTVYEPLSTIANKSSVIFFNADTTDEESVLNAYDNIARFSIANPEKQWSIRIRTVYDATTAQSIRGLSDYATARMRATKAKNQLANRGVPVERIIAEEPTSTDLGYSDENESVFRKLEMVIDPTCTKR